MDHRKTATASRINFQKNHDASIRSRYEITRMKSGRKRLLAESSVKHINTLEMRSGWIDIHGRGAGWSRVGALGLEMTIATKKIPCRRSSECGARSWTTSVRE